jgi:YegS/Rv2252/BmrU family lipid kinase
MKTKVLFIINPISGVHKSKKAEKYISELINKERFDISLMYTEHKGHGIDISRENAGKYDIIAAVGGDGTVNEVAMGLAGNTDTALAIIPTGSGNGLARHMGIKMSLKKNLKRFNNYKKFSADTVSLNGNFFMNVSGTGFDAHVADVFNTFGQRGLKNYAKVTIKEFFSYKPAKYTITDDNNNTITTEAFAISFANSSQFGNNAYISPQADISDGLIDIVIVKRFPVWKTPVLAIRMFTKSMHKSRYTTILRGKKFIIDSETPQPVHLDGDSIKTTFPVNLNINHGNIMIYGPGER